MLAGDLYIADDPILDEEHQRAMALMEAYNASPASDADARRRILGELLGSLGDETVIRPPFYCDYGRHTHIGARTFANFGMVALDVAPIRIGDDVQIGANSVVVKDVPAGAVATGIPARVRFPERVGEDPYDALLAEPAIFI